MIPVNQIVQPLMAFLTKGALLFRLSIRVLRLCDIFIKNDQYHQEFVRNQKTICFKFLIFLKSKQYGIVQSSESIALTIFKRILLVKILWWMCMPTRL